MTQIFRMQNKEYGVKGNRREEIIIVNVVRSSKTLKSELYLRIRDFRHSKHTPSGL